MLVVNCVDKIRNKQGNIKGYTLENQAGQRITIDVKQLKVEIFKGSISVTNLTLTRDGRLVDRVPKTSQVKSINDIEIKARLLKAYLDGLELTSERLLPPDQIRLCDNIAKEISQIIGLDFKRVSKHIEFDTCYLYASHCAVFEIKIHQNEVQVELMNNHIQNIRLLNLNKSKFRHVVSFIQTINRILKESSMSIDTAINTIENTISKYNVSSKVKVSTRSGMIIFELFANKNDSVPRIQLGLVPVGGVFRGYNILTMYIPVECKSTAEAYKYLEEPGKYNSAKDNINSPKDIQNYIEETFSRLNGIHLNKQGEKK